MRLIERMKKGIRSWLEIQEAVPTTLRVVETLDYESNAIKNRIWYRGDGNELSQLYSQISNEVDKLKFWAAKSTKGNDIRKIHTAIPSLMVDCMCEVVLADTGQIEFKKATDQELWDAINDDNKFIASLENAVKECLYIGDGAFKLTIDPNFTEYPIIEFIPGDNVEYVKEYGRIKEIIFKKAYAHNGQRFTLHEHYGYGYITYKLYRNENEVALNSIPETANLQNVSFGGFGEKKKANYIMAVPMMFYKSSKFPGRGQSVFDKKIDAFDALDEAWSQWMDALRSGRSKEYIPESLVPRNPSTGELLQPNPFDNRFIAIGDDMKENSKATIELSQPTIPHDSYLATYITALDLCLQGFISPSTLGIDVKKLDNAEAQREKEKATLYTRNAIITILEKVLPEVAKTAVMVYREYHYQETDFEDISCTIDFGEYGNPSFESIVETLSKAKTGGLMSIEASVEELYGDSKDNEWKDEEITRLKAEQGIAEIEEPAVNLEGVVVNEG